MQNSALLVTVHRLHKRLNIQMMYTNSTGITYIIIKLAGKA